MANATKLTALRDVKTRKMEYIDMLSGDVFADEQGLRPIRHMTPTEYILGHGGQPVRAPNGEIIHVDHLTRAAALHTYRRMAQSHLPSQAPGVLSKMRADIGDTEQLVSMGIGAGQRDEKQILMDLGIADVHIATTNPNYAAGYRIAEGVADVISPPVLVAKQQDYYFTWNKESDFQRKLPNMGAPGAGTPEVNPGLASTLYSCQQYALGGFMPTEVQANADTPLRPFNKLVQMVVDGLLLEREWRVQNILETTSNWGTNQTVTLASGSQWDGGAASDPVKNLHNAIEQSFMPVTGMVMSELLFHDFIRNPGVQKYFTYKDGVKGIPSSDEVARALDLPPIYVAKMKYLTGGAPTYVWGNDCILFRQSSDTPPTSQMDVATSYTFRWLGGGAPDAVSSLEGQRAGGFLVRSFFLNDRGARGGTKVVVTHSDIELVTSGYVGGQIHSAHQ